MDQYSEKIWLLITRKLSGESTPEENILFQQWLYEDSENREFHNRLKSSWDQNPGESVDGFFLSLRFNFKNGLKKLRNKLIHEDDSVNQKSGEVFKNRIIDLDVDSVDFGNSSDFNRISDHFNGRDRH